MTRRKAGAADDSPSGAAPIASREVRIGSDLTIYTVAEWKETLLSELEGSPALAIDLSDVSELDTAGLQLLLFTGREAQRAGKTLTLLYPSNAVMQLLQLCNVGSQLTVQRAPTPGAGG